MIRTSDSTKFLIAALAEFHKAEVSVPKAATNPFFKSKYADLWTIKFMCDPVLTGLGLVVTQFPGQNESGSTLITRLCHTSGEWMEAETPLYLVKDDPQAQGSAITYMRRYSYCAVLGIVADPDDDAEGAMRRTRARPVVVNRSGVPDDEYETVNGEQIPRTPAMETQRIGPGGSDGTEIGKEDGKKLYGAFKRYFGDDCDVPAKLSEMLGRQIKWTSEVTVSERAQLREMMKS